jgi:hypothetical protein
LASLEESTGRAITTHVGFPTRLDMLCTLFRLREEDKEAAATLDKLCEKIRGKLSRQRGEVVHALWVRGAYGSPMTYTVRARGELQQQKAGKPSTEITRVAGLIAQRTQALQELLESKGVLSPP